MREYDSIIQNQLCQGIVEPVDNTASTENMWTTETARQIHYLPHHAIVRQQKETTKIRVVYDASARCGGPSLNDCLHTGPKFHQKIFNILLRFRAHRIAVTADIEKAFLMIEMAVKDRDALRFLWVRDLAEEPPQLVELRFSRVVFGVSSSPFLLNATIRHHLEQTDADPGIVSKLMKAFYVDDLVTGASNENEAHVLYLTARDILKKGGFHLRKFHSNSPLLQMTINKPEIPPEQPTSDTLEPSEANESYASATLGSVKNVSGGTSVLGVQWDTFSDELVMSVEDIASLAVNLDPTKRSTVSLVGRFYDPIGLLSPVVICFKIFLQELCKSQVGWDDPLTGDLLTRWHHLARSLTHGRLTIRIPRCYTTTTTQESTNRYKLYGFCDASLKAYAAVIYLLSESDSGPRVDFVASKTRVAPLKPQTIPRLELLAALLLSRLMSSVTEALQEELHISQRCCYTDSTVALYWIVGLDRCWKPFVQNRVSEIRELLPPEDWSHCSGRDNPADLPSRGLTLQELSTSRLWINGPAWLMSDSDKPPNPPMPDECLAEIRVRDKTELTHGLLAIEEHPAIERIIECERFSSLSRLLSVTTKVLKFCYTLLFKQRPSRTPVSDLVEESEVMWMRSCQRLLPNKKSFVQWRVQFGLFQGEDKVWRCGGRLQNSNLPFSTKHPVILDKDHHLTLLYIRRAHERVKHSGVKATLTELRSKFWIVKGRSVVRQVLRQCFVCRRHEGRPLQGPPPPPLPSFRVQEAHPFTHSGVDFAGPLYVKDTQDSSKVWICLFTCCVVRAIHLELVPDMTTPSFLRCFKRFVARRGLPSKIVSDNGKTFVAADKEIRAIINHPDVQEYLTGLRVKWVFNLPRAPWWGGVFERLIKSVKRCLRKTLGQAKLSYDELSTALTEVEAVINSRPLSYVCSDDIEQPLTPSHLLVGRRIMDFPDHLCEEPEDYEMTPDVLTKRARHLENTLTHFWNRWRKEYLTELRESHRYHKGKASVVSVEVGDVVLIHDSDQPRSFWRMGRVERLIVGQDGKVRGAALRVANNGKCSTLHRALQQLYPLEVAAPGNTLQERNPSMSADHQDDPVTTEPEKTVVPRAQTRPTRNAAKKSKENWRALIEQSTEL